MRIKIFPALLVLSFFLLAAPVFAIGKPNTLPVRSNMNTSVTAQPSGLPTQAQGRLTDAKLKACQARENAIVTRSQHLNQLVTTMEEKFDAIAKRVEQYYITTVIPSGKTVANYDSLVADIAASKATVQTGLAKAQNDVAGFSCDAANPAGDMMTYRKDMQGVIQELKDYRTSIKDLIVAVRSVTGATESAKPSESPEPTQ